MAIGPTFMTEFVSAKDVWSQASSGQSSFRDLGPEFSVTVPLEPVKGRLVLFNDRLAHLLGLTAKSKRELLKKIEESFLLKISDKAIPSKRTGISTYYSDVTPEHSEFNKRSGDGRVVWIGEITLDDEGQSLNGLDVTLKGVGRTQLAIDIIKGPDGQPHPMALQYGDGLQTMTEAVRSFIASEAMVGNKIRSTVDLAVFELPFLKRNPATGKMEKAALTVRVGSQVRIANIEYFKKGSPEHKKIVDFVIRRGLKLEQNKPISDKEAWDYLFITAFKFAEVAAKYRDSQFFHGSLTNSNVSTEGFAFDFGTLLAMDVFQPEISSDAAHHAKAKDQWKTFYSKVKTLLTHVNGAGYLNDQPDLSGELANFFVSHYDGQNLILTLKRLGLSELQLSELIKKGVMPSVSRFMDIVEEIQGKLSPYKSNYVGRKIYPVAFDIRKILKGSFAIALLPHEKQMKEWHKLFLIDKSWSVQNDKDLRMSDMREYINELSNLADLLQENGVNLQEAAERAAKIGVQRKDEGFFPDYSKLLKQIQTDKVSVITQFLRSDLNYEFYSAEANKLSDSLVDFSARNTTTCENELNK